MWSPRSAAQAITHVAVFCTEGKSVASGIDVFRHGHCWTMQ
jgi:hypothetical protein